MWLNYEPPVSSLLIFGFCLEGYAMRYFYLANVSKNMMKRIKREEPK